MERILKIDDLLERLDMTDEDFIQMYNYGYNYTVLKEQNNRRFEFREFALKYSNYNISELVEVALNPFSEKEPTGDETSHFFYISKNKKDFKPLIKILKRSVR